MHLGMPRLAPLNDMHLVFCIVLDIDLSSTSHGQSVAVHVLHGSRRISADRIVSRVSRESSRLVAVDRAKRITFLAFSRHFCGCKYKIPKNGLTSKRLIYFIASPCSSYCIFVLLFVEGKVVTHPIAGTRPRGKTSNDDLALEKDLLSDPKEIAEHLMLVDLGRNDTNRVCEVRLVVER